MFQKEDLWIKKIRKTNFFKFYFLFHTSCEIKNKPYLGHIEKLKEPIELKGRIIQYKPVAKFSGKTYQKKTSKIMKGGVLYSIKVIAKLDVRNTILDELKQIIPKNPNSFLKQYKINLVNYNLDGNPSFIFSTMYYPIFWEFLVSYRIK